MKHPCTGVILAGGLSTRLSGINKAFIEVGGRRILDRIYDVYSQLFDEIILVTNDPSKYLDWDLRIVSDLYDVRSSLTGLHAGLFYANYPNIFAVACDTPFLRKEVVEKVLSYMDENTGVVVPEVELGLEPLCAAYSRSCLPALERNLKAGNYRIRQFFKASRTKKIPEHILRKTDPELLSFFNVNTPEELLIAEKMVRSDQLSII